MKKLDCAICEGKHKTRILVKPNFDINKIGSGIFSARRLPDRLHYQINECSGCGLIFSSPILPAKKIEGLYKQSKFTYGQEAEYLTESYAFYFKKYFSKVRKDVRILEVGCGNGFFLEKLSLLGIGHVYGIEPSLNAVSKASENLKKNIKIDILRYTSFSKSFFDIVVCFQTLDHVVNPNEFIKIIYSLLREKGAVFFVVHDTGGLSVKLFGKKSPIFDIEHIYLFNKKNLAKIFKKNGYKKVQVFDLKNKFPLSYWFRMSPVPLKIKPIILKFLEVSQLGQIPLSFSAGNVGIVAYK